MSEMENTVKKLQLSIESNVLLNDSYSLLDYIEIANEIKIPIIIVNGITIEEKNKLITESKNSKFEFVSLTNIYESVLDTSYSLF